MEDTILKNSWTLYYHPSREKRWTLDSFEKIAVVKKVSELLSIYKELGEKIKCGMYFWMRESIPPLWENFQNIRGGSYSLRGVGDDGILFFKLYSLGMMLESITVEKEDVINGISISPKLQGFGGQQKVGYFIVKIWNRDSDKFKSKTNLLILNEKLLKEDILYTPHVEKKM